MKASISALLLALLAGTVSAQTIANISVEPATAKVGEPVKITATFDNATNPNCNVRVNFGDGTTHDFKINQAKDVPLVTTRSYAKAGDYRVRVEGKTALPVLKCSGETKSAMLKVAVPASAVAAVAGPACPDGWKLDAKSVNKKSGAFSCGAKAGTALPSARLECPGALSYFENKAKGQLGCRT